MEYDDALNACFIAILEEREILTVNELMLIYLLWCAFYDRCPNYMFGRLSQMMKEHFSGYFSNEEDHYLFHDFLMVLVRLFYKKTTSWFNIPYSNHVYQSMVDYCRSKNTKFDLSEAEFNIYYYTFIRPTLAELSKNRYSHNSKMSEFWHWYYRMMHYNSSNSTSAQLAVSYMRPLMVIQVILASGAVVNNNGKTVVNEELCILVLHKMLLVNQLQRIGKT